MAQILLDAGAELRPVADPFPRSEEVWTLLHMAISKTDSLPMVDVLLRSGRCDVNEVNGGWTALQAAVDAVISEDAADDAVLRLLLAQPGINIQMLGDPNYSNSRPPLITSLDKCWTPAPFQALMEAGADPNVVDDVELYDFGIWEMGMDTAMNGATPLHLAAYYGNDEAVEALLAAGGRVDARCSAGYTPLALAAIHVTGYKKEKAGKMVKALIEAGSDINDINAHRHPDARRPVLYYALQFGLGEVCALLLEAGADPALVAQSTAELVYTALLFSPDEEKGPKIKALADAGVDLAGATHPETGRPLLLAVAAGWRSQEAIAALVGAGADATAVDHQGRTALQIILMEMGERGDMPHQGEIRAETVVACVRAGDLDSWDLIPYNFEGLECLLYTVSSKSPDKLGQLVSKWTEEAKVTVQTALLAMNRVLPGGECLKQIHFKIGAQAFD